MQKVALTRSFSNLKKLKILCRGHMFINDLNGEEIVGDFYKKEFKTNQKKFRIEKTVKRKGNKLYVKWKEYNNSFNSWVDKMSEYFPKPKSLGANVKFELGWSNYTTKADLKDAIAVDISSFAKKLI